MEIHICVACTVNIAVILVTVCRLDFPMCAECYGQWLNLAPEFTDTPALNSEKE